MRGALRRLVVAITLPAASAATFAVGSAFGQDPGTGHKDVGESASPWHGIFAFLGWILLALVVCGLLVWMAIGRRRETASAVEPHPPGGAPASSPPDGVEARSDTGAQELTVLTFDRTDGAERAYADAHARAGTARWLREVAFVECHRRGRIVVRGTFAGHYLDVDDVADAIGRDTAVGERAALFDEIRRDIPEGSSGLVALNGADDSEALIDALHHRAVRITHHRVSAAEAAAFDAAVAQTPSAATPDV
jgi:hypothetical protein